MNWSDWLSIYGAGVGTGSMVVAGLAYRAQVIGMRADEPNVHVWGSILRVGDGLYAYVSLTNKGRGDVSIDSVSVSLFNDGDRVGGIPGDSELPVRILGKSGQHWTVPLTVRVRKEDAAPQSRPRLRVRAYGAGVTFETERNLDEEETASVGECWPNLPVVEL
jgi:hypothetical protein